MPREWSLNSVKSIGKRAIRSLGYELRRYAPVSSERAQLARLLQTACINLVLDVGANAGGFGSYLREIGYRDRIVSFEPLSSAHLLLVKRSSRDEKWIAAPRCAVGHEDGEVAIQIAGNSESSSILDMKQLHCEAAPGSGYVGTEMAPMKTLDSASASFISGDSKILLKVDTQGYEEHVLSGAIRTLAQTAILQMELSLVELYSGQKLLPETLSFLDGLGFELWGLSPVFADARSGRILQYDGVFLRRG